MLDLNEYLKTLEEIVNIESHSRMPDGTKNVAKFLDTKFKSLGWNTELIDIGSNVGPCLKVTNKEEEKYDILLLGHMDTVFPAGTVAERPFSIKDGKFTGPGASDMKAGVLYMYYLAKALSDNNLTDKGSICLLFNPDEEISSIASRPVIEHIAKNSSNALILESARANGALVNCRKGIAKYRITFNGIAAHAGVDPDSGASAINEFVKWAQEIIKLADKEKGTTVNIGVINGGTGANVVAEKAVCDIDVRLTDIAEGNRVDSKLKELQANPFDQRVKVDITGGILRPPFNASDKSLQLCRLVDSIAEKLGIDIKWVATGGGSDGNFTAALGVPTIDGLGPIGGGAHSEREYGEIDSIIPRFNLLFETVKTLLQK